MLNLGKKLGFAALLAFGTISSANAGVVVLDTFDYDEEVNISDPGTQDAIRFDINALLADVIYKITRTTGVLGSALTHSFNALDGDLKWSNPSGIESMLEMTYTELNESPGAVLFDATGGGAQDAFYFDVEKSDAGFSISVIVGSNGEADLSSWSILSPEVSSSTRQTAQFDAFSTIAGLGADFTALEFVKIILTSNNVDAVDLHISEFGTIPEPTTVAIFGLGLIGFALSRRKAK